MKYESCVVNVDEKKNKQKQINKQTRKTKKTKTKWNRNSI